MKELRKQNADPHEPEVHVVKSTSRGEVVPVDCSKCRTRHAIRSCPAFGKSCHKCEKIEKLLCPNVPKNAKKFVC